MQANWSLILNVVLLVGVVYAIIHLLQMRKRAAHVMGRSPSIGPIDIQTQHDDIIAVRKVSEDLDIEPIQPAIWSNETFTMDESALDEETREQYKETKEQFEETPSFTASTQNVQSSEPLVMFLLSKANRQLAGYELLQAVLAAGLRFGEGNLFHRHQYSNGQGTIMCSLAAATDQGVFDLQNIGAFTVRGLCIYMHASGNPGIDEERFDIMLDTAKTLSDDLDTYLLDDQRQPLSEASIERYHQRLNLPSLEVAAIS